MNKYTLTKKSYQELLEQKVIDEKEAMKNIRICEFLETCDQDDICILADSGAFNDIIEGYCKVAIKQGSTNGIFDLFNAYDALKNHHF